MKTAYEYSKEIFKKIVPSMSYDGGDFISWQKTAKEKLCSLLGMDKFEKTDLDVEVEYEKKIDNATEIRFTFQSEKGYRVPAVMRLPDDVENPPVMICLQGHATGMHISLGIAKYPGDEETISGGDRNFSVRAVKEKIAAVAMDQRNFGECGGDENGPDCLESSMNALLMGRTTIGERVWDVSRLIDVLYEKFPDKVDLSNIWCMGNSGGGTTTVYAAAIEDRISLAMPSCAMCTYKESIARVTHCVCNYIPGIAMYFDMGDIMAMACPKYFIQVSGLHDRDFSIKGAKDAFEKGEQAYIKNGCQERCALIVGEAGHRFYADLAYDKLREMLNNK